jgi:DNA repair exonuclease SbcCD ATPase subunit
MKDIRLKRLRAIYFKGFKDFEVEFKDRTIISGRNRSGKSSVFDALMWLLFGKDSLGNTDFDIKTLDEKRRVIEKVDHEVYAELEINGAVTTLKRVLRENWVKPLGQENEILKGNEVKCFFDGVPVSVGDFQKRVSEIVDENLFKLITNISYFHSLKREDRRSILLSLAGDISNDDIARENDLGDIAELLKNSSSEDLKKKISAEKKRIKEELDHIPIRIDEIKKNMPEAVNFDAISKEIEQKKTELSKIDKQINDRQESVKAQIEEANKKREIAGNLRMKQTDIILNARQDAVKEATEKNRDFYNYQEILKEKQEKVVRYERRVLEKKNDISEAHRLIGELKKEREKLVEQWKAESAKVYADELDDSCPFCGHVFTDEEKLETRQSGEAEFNKIKSEKLAKINKAGLSLKERIINHEKTLSEMEKELLSVKSEHEAACQDFDTFSKITPARVESKTVVKEEIPEWVELERQINSIEIEDVKQDNSDLIEKRKNLNDEIVSLSVELNKKEQIENSFKRVDELESEQRTLSQSLSNKEKIEFRLLSFNKLKMEEVDRRIKEKFKFVKFKLFDKTYEGNEFETCETLIDGVRYWSSNNEGRINAGLDIVNAICEHNGVYAPVFIDNAEGVNEFITTKSQLIELRVTTGDLTIG